MIQNIILPKQGLQMTEGFITRWLLKEGDAVKEGEPLFEMETDKLVITIDATCSGKLLKILYPEGSTVPITTVIAYVGEEGDAVPESAPAPSAPEPAAAAVPVPEAVTEASPQPQKETMSAAPAQGGRLFATPRARTTAAAKGYDLEDITPSGPDGLIIERDVLSYAPAVSSGKMVCAAPCVLSARIALFTEGDITPESVLRLAYRKAAEKTGISCGDTPAIRILKNSEITFCMIPSEEAQITVCGENLTLAFYPEAAEEDSVLEFFELFCMFAQKPWLAAVR